MNSYLLLCDISIDDLDYEIKDNKIIINNFVLFTNKNKLIYKISSYLQLEPLLDFLYNYSNITIQKIYNVLIIKYLLLKDIIIYPHNFLSFKKKYYNKYLYPHQYYICNNNEIIITSPIKFNICIIINNLSLNKSFIYIIDNIQSLNKLYELILNSNVYYNYRFENIKITIIGGSLNNINILIEIYKILKDLKLSKMIYKTYLFNNFELNKIKYNSKKNKIKSISSLNNYVFIDLRKQLLQMQT